MQAITEFKKMFTHLTSQTTLPLESIYSPQVRFEDPIHTLNGIGELRNYFERLNTNLNSCQFVFGEEVIGPDTAFLTWKMEASLKRPNKTIQVTGISFLKLDGSRITFQRDYFDVGALVYEHIPLLGGIIRLIKRSI